MFDPGLNEFHGRLRRIYKIRRRGGAFEAAGTLGRSYYVQRRSPSFFRPILVFLAVSLVLKAGLLMHIGETDYKERVARLAEGTQLEQAGAFVMQADPITVWLSVQMRDILSLPA